MPKKDWEILDSKNKRYKFNENGLGKIMTEDPSRVSNTCWKCAESKPVITLDLIKYKSDILYSIYCTVYV